MIRQRHLKHDSKWKLTVIDKFDQILFILKIRDRKIKRSSKYNRTFD